MVEKLVRRCCICNTIELDGKMIPFGAPGNMGQEGYKYTHAYFSRSCVVDFYGAERANSIRLELLELDSCPTIEDFVL